MTSSTQNELELQSGQKDTNMDVAIIEPPREFIPLIERTALLAYYEGEEYETSMRSSNLEKPSLGLNFLNSSDPYHAYYKKKLPEYRTQTLRPPKKMHIREDLTPYKLTSLPEGITGKELDYVKLTAMFAARYGAYFLGQLVHTVDKGPHFQFLDPSDSRFEYFSQLSSAYSSLLVRSNEPAIPRKTLVDDFLRLLQEPSGVEMAMIDLHAREYVANIGDSHMPPPGYHSGFIMPPSVRMMKTRPTRAMFSPPLPLPEEPEEKNQKFDESALVPEDHFLAQHPGLSTIRVSVPDGRLLEITVQSLSEKVASLKEKIDEEIKIPANQQKLSGKAGVLEDNMSLAHYNNVNISPSVGPNLVL